MRRKNFHIIVHNLIIFGLINRIWSQRQSFANASNLFDTWISWLGRGVLSQLWISQPWIDPDWMDCIPTLHPTDWQLVCFEERELSQEGTLQTHYIVTEIVHWAPETPRYSLIMAVTIESHAPWHLILTHTIMDEDQFTYTERPAKRVRQACEPCRWVFMPLDYWSR